MFDFFSFLTILKQSIQSIRLRVESKLNIFYVVKDSNNYANGLKIESHQANNQKALKDKEDTLIGLNQLAYAKLLAEKLSRNKVMEYQNKLN